MKKLLAAVLTASMIVSLVGCGGAAKSSNGSSEPAKTESKADGGEEKASGNIKSIEGKTVAFIPKLTGNSFFEAANNGAQKYAKEWGIKVDYMGSANATVTDQLEVIQQAIDAGVDAIAISSVDATALDEKLKEAQNAGIVVCTWDSDVSPDARSMMVSQGTADVLGPMLVDMGVESLKDRGVDPNGEVKYAWHYSQAAVADQNSWYVAGEKYIKEKYPK